MMIRNKRLLKTFRVAGLCESCQRYCKVREPHHLRAKGMGGNGVLDLRINLISLGGSVLLPDGRRLFGCACHHDVHTGKIAAERILRVVALREKVHVEEIIEVMDFLRRLVKPTEAQLRVALTELSPAAKQLALRELTEAKMLMGA